MNTPNHHNTGAGGGGGTWVQKGYPQRKHPEIPPDIRKKWKDFIDFILLNYLIKNGLGSQVIVFRLQYSLSLPRTSGGSLTSWLS